MPFYDVTPANPLSGVTLSGGDSAVVFSGGKATSVVLENGSEITVSSGGVASLTTLSGGFEFVSSGGGVIGTVLRGGTEAVSSGGAASFSVVSGDGSQAVYAGGSAMGTVVTGGLEAIYSGGSVSGTMVEEGGAAFVYAGGAATGTVLRGGGDQTLLAGVASGTIVSGGGALIVNSGGSAVFAAVSNAGTETVGAGGLASFTTVSGGGFEVVSGGMVRGTVVSGGGQETVVAGGVASGTAVSGLFAAQIVSAGGKASGTVIDGTAATETVSYGGVAVSTTLRAGFLYVSSGGTASFASVSNGFAVVSRGGVVLSDTVAGGFEQVSFSGVASFTMVIGGYQQVFSGGVASGTTVISGYQQVLSGGLATGTILSGGFQQVGSGGTAGSTVVSSDGSQQVRGGTAVGAIVDGGFQNLSSGGIASGTVIRGGFQSVYSGSLASGTILSGGGETVFSGGIVSATVVSSGGMQLVALGGTASGTAVREVGVEVVASGGTAGGTVVDSGGTLVVNAGGTASFIMVSSGGSIDFPGLVYSGGGSAIIGGTDGLTVTEGGSSATLQLEGTYMSKTFQTSKDSGDGTVVTLLDSPRTLVWTGAKDTNFANAADWNDVTNGLNPAGSPPGATDTAEFLTSGGTITGTGTAAALEFGGIAAWELNASASLSAQAGVTVGQNGSGTLLVDGGASIDGLGTSDDISGSSGGVAGVTVSGAGSLWNSSGELVVGNLGIGTLSITNSANVSATAAGSLPALALGAGSGGSGSLTVTGVGSRATLVGQLDVGEAGGGTLTVSNQGTVLTGNDPALDPSEGVDIAQASGGSGVADITGSKSLLNNTGAFIVGDAGLGGLSIQSGATVTTTPGTGGAGLIIANTTAASGSSVNVSGAGSDLAVTGTLIVGSSGYGSLSLSQGATATASSLDVAAASSGDGAISIAGSGTTLDIAGSLTLGDQAAGELSILGGAQMTIAGGEIGGTGVDGTGNLDIEDAGSTLTINGGTLLVGANGPAEFTLGIGGTLDGEVATEPNGVTNLYGNVDPATLLNDGAENIGNSQGGTSQSDDFYIANSGTITIKGTATFYTPLVTFETAAADGSTTGLWVIAAKDTLVMNAASADASQTFDFTSASAAELVIGQVPSGPNINNLDTMVQNGTTMTTPFLTASPVLGASALLNGGWAAPIENYQVGDTIVLQGLTYGSASASGDVVTVWSGEPNVSNALGSLVFVDKSGSTTSAASLAEAAAAAAQITPLPCFAAGTRIATADGLVKVERLAVGDRVRTVLGGVGSAGSGRDWVQGDAERAGLGGPGRGEARADQYEPIVWVGSRAVNCVRHPKPETVWPVRVRAGAFGENVPVCDLYLSPDHAVYVDGVLVPVKLLVNGTSIAQVKRKHVVYYHVELEQHDVVLAEGLPAETYLDTGDRAKFSGERLITLHPDFTARIWEMASAAPLVVTGAKLIAIKQWLNILATDAPGDVAVA